MTYAPTNAQSSYLPEDFDIPKENEGIRIFVNNRERLTASILNIKENAQYEKNELLTGQQWFSATSGNSIVTQSVFRTTFDLVQLNGGAIPGGTTTINITSSTTPPLISYANSLVPVHIFGAAVSGNNLLPLPYASGTGANIEIWYVNTNPTTQSININNQYGANLSSCIIVLEYWKT